MTYIVTADWHVHNWSQFATVDEHGVNSRLNHVLHEIERMGHHADVRDIGTIYVAGDVFHVRGSVRPSVLNPLMEKIERVARVYGVEFRIMPGNHDLEGRDTTWLGDAINALHSIGGVTVINRRALFFDDKVAMIPWCNTREDLLEQVEAVREELHAARENLADWDLHLHTGINGVLIGMPDHGWAPEELAALGFRRVYCGHYHNHVRFNVPIEGRHGDIVREVTSIGALTHQTWSDVDTLAGFIVVNEDEHEFIETEAPSFVDFDPSFALMSEEEVETAYRGNYVRVRGLELDEAEMRTVREELEAVGVTGVVIHPVPKSRTTSRSGSKSGVSLEASISDWIKSAEIENPAVERGALEVLNEARSVE